jgi:hypothetical protein
MEQQHAIGARFNYGFERVERLAGNIGYLDLRAFDPVAVVGDTAAAAMTFLSNTEAVIIDLRKNTRWQPAAGFIDRQLLLWSQGGSLERNVLSPDP